MSYVLRNKNKIRFGLFKKIIFGVIIFGCISLVLLLIPSFFTNSLISTLSLFWKTSNAVQSDVATNFGFFRSKVNLIQENQALKKTLEEMRLRDVSYNVLKKDHDVLLSLFGRIKPEGYILAGVLIRPPQAPYDNLIVDAGSEDGVRIGDLAFASDVVILGEVVEVYNNQSKIELYSTSGRKISGFISRTSTSVSLEGRGGGDFEISVPKEVVVNESDVFVTLGVTGHLLAHVTSIDSRPAGSFQKILAQSPANLSQIRWVFLKRQ